MGARINGPLNWFNKANKTKAGNIQFHTFVCQSAASATKNLDHLLLLFQPIKKQCWIFSRSAIFGLVVVDGQDFAHTFRQTVIQKCDLSKATCFQLNYYLYCLPRQLLYFHPRQKMLVLLFFESDSCHNLKGNKTIFKCVHF